MHDNDATCRAKEQGEDGALKVGVVRGMVQDFMILDVGLEQPSIVTAY